MCQSACGRVLVGMVAVLLWGPGCGGGSSKPSDAGPCNGAQLPCQCSDGRSGTQCQPKGTKVVWSCVCSGPWDAGTATDGTAAADGVGGAETAGKSDTTGTGDVSSPSDTPVNVTPDGGALGPDGTADQAADHPVGGGADSGLEASSVLPEGPPPVDVSGREPGLDVPAISDGNLGVDSDTVPGNADAADIKSDSAGDPATPDTRDTTADSRAGDLDGPSPDAAPDLASDTPAPPPTLASLCAESVRGGAFLVIRGSGFSTSSANIGVSFAGTVVTPTAAQPDTLVVQTPPSVVAGVLTVTVGGQTSNSLSYDVGPRKGNVDGTGAGLPGVPQGVASNADGHLVALTMLVNGRTEIVLLDRDAGTVTRMPTADRAPPNNDMNNPQLSADGRYLAFDSTASNLVAGDTNTAADVFLYDVSANTVSRISVGLGGEEASGVSRRPFLNANGRFVVFESTATNLTFDDNNAMSDVFLFDRELGTIRCLSLNAASMTGNPLGNTANGASTRPVISADGFIIAYQSDATTIVASDTNSASDIFVYDRRTSKNSRVSLAPGSTQSNGASYNPSLSADGRLVVFTSLAGNLLTGNADSNSAADVFAYDRLATPPAAVRVSMTATGGQASGSSISVRNSVSADGRFVLFASDAPDMATGAADGDSNGATDVFVRDLQAGTTRLASVNSTGAPVDGASPAALAAADGQMALTADGRLLLFLTAATNLLANDSNGVVDVAITPNSLEQCPPPTLLGTSQDALRARTSLDVYAHSLDPDPGQDAVTFATAAGVTSAGDRYHLGAVAPENVAAGSLVVQVTGGPVSKGLPYTLMPVRANLGAASAWADADATDAVTSADGQRIVFVSAATNLQGGHTSSATDVFVYDRWAGASSGIRVNRSTSGAYPTTGQQSSAGRISADGRFVAYVSGGSSLVANDTNAVDDVFVYDLQTTTNTRASVDSAEQQATGTGSYGPAISRDGRYVAFYSDAANLVAGDLNGLQDVFLRDRWLGTTALVSQATSGTQGNGGSRDPAISADGRYVAFRSSASSLLAVSEDTNGCDDIFLRDTAAPATVRVSVSSAGTQADGDSRSPAISADGRYVVFESVATNLVTGDGNGAADIFVRDTKTSTTTRVSRATGGGDANGASLHPSISADGRFIAFESTASNLVASDTNGFGDAFVYDQQTGTISRLSTTSDSRTAGNDMSGSAVISPEGRFVVFTSKAQNLASGDTKAFFDVFLTSRSP